MRFSQKFKASPHCLPSPDGRLVATLLATGIQIQAVDRLGEIANVVSLPANLAATAVVSFQWSPSSKRILAATSDQILVAAALAPASQDCQPFRAVIRNPSLPVVAKPTYVGFGPSDDRVCLCSAFGIKFAVFDLQAGKTVEISNPKFYSSESLCSRGLSFRPASQHLAILTRTAGKDWISVHDQTASTTVASWAPDTIDAQGLVWSPDGRWLAVWDSPAHGHKILFYTPDGHLFKTWTGVARRFASQRANNEGSEGGSDVLNSAAHAVSAVDEVSGPGVRLVQFSANARLLAVGDASRTIRIIDMSSITTSKRLVHPTSLRPHAGTAFTIWQEQIGAPATADAGHSFIEATRDVSPPGRPAAASSDSAAASSGCTLITYDCSSTILASRLEEAPTTVWVWNIETAQLCSVLMLHANVSTAVWHPSAPHTLLITCEGDRHRGLGVVWNPLRDSPQAADFSQHSLPASNESHLSPGSSPFGKHRPVWLALDGIPPSLFYSDGNEFSLASLDKNDNHKFKSTGSLPWLEADRSLFHHFSAGKRWAAENRAREESPLELVPASADIEGDSELDDTFHYKRDD